MNRCMENTRTLKRLANDSLVSLKSELKILLMAIPQYKSHIILIAILFILLLVVFISSLLIGKGLDIEIGPLATVLSATALSLSAIISFSMFRKVEEPWVKTYREMHNEFWGNEKLAIVRKWLCCNKMYEDGLCKILNLRLTDKNALTVEDYDKLEILDQFCSFMLRIVNVDMDQRNIKARKTMYDLGFLFWMTRLVKRNEVEAYIRLCWLPLDDYLKIAREELEFKKILEID